MSGAGGIVIVSVVGFAFWATLAYIGLLKPVLWLRLPFPLAGQRATPEYEQKMLNDELYMAKCRVAGVFGLIGVAVFAYSLFVNVPKLF